MGGAWVFPGGALRHEEKHADAAVRELEEEAGIRLEARSSLAPFSRWITPAEVKVRFDAHFFVAEAPPGARAEPDGRECVDARWLRPAEALDGHGDGELVLVFPTIKQLEQLAAFSSVAEVLEAAQGRRVRAIQPRVIVERGVERIVLPGEPGYDA
jgi:8-oxo-dGTP pyrophosphatase MutT (NUDIX family)